MAHILLIESDRVLADNISKAFTNARHQVDWRVDPQIALDSADNNPPEAIILDLVLANRSGVEFLYEFRSYPDWQSVPVIIFSSLSAEELKESVGGFRHLNITAYHYKPNTRLDELVTSVEKTF